VTHVHYESGGGWVPGENFDPNDPEEMEIMREVWDRERADAVSRTQRESEDLRENEE
jgi:hypothetical protein